MRTKSRNLKLRATVAGMAMAMLPFAVMAVDPGRGVGAPGPGVAPGVGAPGPGVAPGVGAPGVGAVDPGRNQPGAAGNVGVGAPGVGAPGVGVVDPGLNQPGVAGNVGGVARTSVRR
jgi:hypothetical protein